MLYATHYEPEDFLTIVNEKKLEVFERVYVLNCGIAGIVFMCKDKENLYYLDRLLPSEEKTKQLDQIDFYEFHQELYAKINLDESQRRKSSSICVE